MTTTTDQPSLLRSTQTYQDAARTVLSHSIFSRTKLTISTSGIAAELRKQFPELQEVGVSLPLLNRRPVITLVPATAALILTDTQGNRFVVSDKGQTVIAVRDAQNVDGMHLPIINDTSTTTLQNKQNVLTASEVGFVQTILAELTAKQLKPSSLSLPATPSELDIKLEGLDYLVKFNMQTDGRQAVGTFLAVKNQLDKTNQKPAEYIDVRVEERAYYK